MFSLTKFKIWNVFRIQNTDSGNMTIDTDYSEMFLGQGRLFACINLYYTKRDDWGFIEDKKNTFENVNNNRILIK